MLSKHVTPGAYKGKERSTVVYPTDRYFPIRKFFGVWPADQAAGFYVMSAYVSTM